MFLFVGFFEMHFSKASKPGTKSKENLCLAFENKWYFTGKSVCVILNCVTCWLCPWQNLENLICESQTVFFLLLTFVLRFWYPGYRQVSDCWISTTCNCGPYRARANRATSSWCSPLSKSKAKFYLMQDVRQATKWASQEDDAIRRLFLHPVSTLEQKSVFCRFAVKVCRTVSLTVLYPENPEQTAQANLRCHRAARRPAMTAVHHQAHLCCCWQHVHWETVLIAAPIG